jgi:hypothetical protein
VRQVHTLEQRATALQAELEHKEAEGEDIKVWRHAPNFDTTTATIATAMIATTTTISLDAASCNESQIFTAHRCWQVKVSRDITRQKHVFQTVIGNLKERLQVHRAPL